MSPQRVWSGIAALLIAAAGVAADETPPALERLNAPDAVELGNRLLLEENAEGALEAYRHAEQLEPDAAEIDFNEGLGLFQLGEFEEARQAFEKAATSKNERLANDATYGAATTYHAEALKRLDNPQAAIEKLEHAIQRYQSVLANEPKHDAARDAHLKAATTRRQLIQLLEQQQQQPQQQQEQDQEQDEKQDQSDSEQQQSEERQEQSEDQQQQEENASQDQQQEDQSQEQQQQEQSQSDEQQSEEPSSSSEEAQDDQEEQAQQEPTAEREEVSREQAERRLREMMQSIRDREKQRRERVRPLPVAPTEKDW